MSSSLDPFRKRQSPRTGFIHLFPADESATDTIPIYENFLFVFTLFQQKTVEAVLEGKELIERLLSFQNSNGNFPIYIHDFPRCWDFLQPLKIAPLFIHIIRDFGSVLGSELKEKMEASLQKMVAFPLKKTTPLWEQRARAIQNLPIESLDTTHFTPQEWAEWIITCQLSDPSRDLFPIPFDPELQLFLGPGEIQEKGDPFPWAIEWLLAREPRTSRFVKNHIQQIYAAPFFPFNTSHPSYDGAFRICWKGTKVHSLAAYGYSKREGNHLFFDLPEGIEIGRELLFEASLFCDLSEETQLFIEGKKGTVFRLGEKVSIQSADREYEVRFTLVEGEGTFCGHLFRANRPTQIAKGYEAYDWQIGIRTLRRSGKCRLAVEINSSNS